MKFNIPMRTVNALDRNSLISYGTSSANNILPCFDRQSVSSLGQVMQQYHQPHYSDNGHSNSQYQNNYSQQNNYNNYNNYNNPYQNTNQYQNNNYSQNPAPEQRVNTLPPTQPQTARPASQPQARTVPAPVQPVRPPKKNHPLPSPDVALMQRGQKFAVNDRNGNPLKNLRIGVGWDILDSRCELDASAFVLGNNGKVLGDDWFVFYGQPQSPDGNIKYITGSSSGDDANLDVNLMRLRPDIQKIVFSVTIYEAFQKRLNFGMVENVYARITDMDTNKEIVRFSLTDCYSNVTAMVVGELYRYNGNWKFNAVGSGVNRDLAQFCGMYGVALTD